MNKPPSIYSNLVRKKSSFSITTTRRLLKRLVKLEREAFYKFFREKDMDGQYLFKTNQTVRSEP